METFHSVILTTLSVDLTTSNACRGVKTGEVLHHRRNVPSKKKKVKFKSWRFSKEIPMFTFRDDHTSHCMDPIICPHLKH